jgi:DNA repair exonuclease SbcCD ATPase subunit
MNQEEFNEIISRYQYNSYHDAERIKKLEAALQEEKAKSRDIDAIVSNFDIQIDELKRKVKLLEAAGDDIVASASFSRMAKTMAFWQKLRNLPHNNEQPNGQHLE